MVIQFQSFIEPLVVLLAAPLSFVGAMLLLLVTGTPLNVSSFMGLILLVGLIVKNGIILLDFTKHLMKEAGLPLEKALREAARIRLRPILMTTLCTLFGSPAARARDRGRERPAAPIGARRHRRSRVVDADHVVRRAEPVGRDPRARVCCGWRSLCGRGAGCGAKRVDHSGSRRSARVACRLTHARPIGGASVTSAASRRPRWASSRSLREMIPTRRRGAERETTGSRPTFS